MIPSMVSIGERVALREHLALNFEGIGAVVEIGALAGSSAIAIMQGISKSRHQAKLHVYDAFLFPKNDLESVYRKLLPRQKGDSFREEFYFQTRQWKDAMIVVEGDASKQKWTGGPIEFMHIDCSISREFHEAIALEFYPHLMQNSVIAHQDYDYGRAPFIAEIMTSLATWFKPIMHIQTTKYFRCLKEMTREEIAASLSAGQKAAA